MAINNYATLNTAVSNWLDRDDLTNRIPEFIALAEARFNRKLRIRMMETISTEITTVGGKKDYDLPAGYVQMKEFHLNTSPITPLSYITPEMMFRLEAGSTSGKPSVYTIMTGKVSLGPTPAAAYETSMLYYKTIDPLTSLEDTNAMLTENPDIYLYGALLEAEPFLMNDQRVQLWAMGFSQAITDLQEQDNKDRHSGSGLRVLNTGGYP